MREINVKYFFLDSSSWSWESKHIDYHYLQGTMVIYGAKPAIIMSFLKSPMLQYNFSWNFLILKAVFLFPSELEWLWSVASWRIGRWTRYLHKEIWEVLKKTALAPQIPVHTTEFASAWDIYSLFYVTFLKDTLQRKKKVAQEIMWT